MSRPLRILAVHRYFWPDTPPYAAMLRVLAGHWAEAGHRVEVLTSQPSYKVGTDLTKMPARDHLDGVAVRRLSMRPDAGPRGRKARNMVRFSALVFLRVLFGARRDLVMCSTAPQVLLAWATSWAARIRGARFVYHVMDVHPEIGRLSGEFANPLVFRVLRAMDRASCRRAAAVIVLSDDMRAAVLSRDPSLAAKVHVLNNFDLPDFEATASAPPADSAAAEAGEDRLNILFAGNLGRFQGLEELAEALLGDPDPRLDAIRLLLMGEGAARAGLQQRIERAEEAVRGRVRLLPHGSAAQARAAMRSADLGLVSLAPEVVRYAYPSKTATYLSEGLPVLVSVEPDSALARDVVGWDVGGALPRGDVPALRRALLEWATRRDHLADLRDNARVAWEREFSTGHLLPRWDQVLLEATEGLER